MQYIEIKSQNNILRGFLEGSFAAKALIIFFHGFTGNKNENGLMFKTLAKDLVSHGYATLRVDFAGSGDSDGEFSDMTISTEMEDGIAIMEYAKGLPFKKRYLAGFSMGGAVASMIAPQFINDLTGLILMSPAGNMTNLASDYEKRLTRIDENTFDLNGLLLGQKFIDDLRKHDLYQNAIAFTKPVLIIHGEKDLSVPVEIGRKYASLYPNVKFNQIDGASHCYTTIPHRQQLHEKVHAFLERTIGE